MIMGWYKLFLWYAPWSKRPRVNMIDYYKNYLYDNWFNSLSIEEQEKEKERIRKIKLSKDAKTKEIIDSFFAIRGIISGAYNRIR